MHQFLAAICLSSLILLGSSKLPALAEDHTPLAVLDFQAKGGVSQDEASIISDRIRTNIFRSGRYEVMERANMLAILKEQGFQQTQSNCDSTSCSVEVGKLLAVRQLMTGSVSKLGSIYTLSFRILDVEKGKILHDVYRDCRCSLEEVLTKLTGEIMTELTLSEPLQPESSAQLSDDELNQRIAQIPQAERWSFYQRRKLEPAAAIGLNAVPLLPFGYTYLDDWPRFWTFMGLEAGALALGAGLASVTSYGQLSNVWIGTGAVVAGIWGYSLFDSYGLTEQKNQNLKARLQLGLEPAFSQTSSLAYWPLAKYQVSF